MASDAIDAAAAAVAAREAAEEQARTTVSGRQFSFELERSSGRTVHMLMPMEPMTLEELGDLCGYLLGGFWAREQAMMQASQVSPIVDLAGRNLRRSPEGLDG